MRTPNIMFLTSILGMAALLPAQQHKDGPAKAPDAAAARKDDPVTANDKAVMAIDKFIAKQGTDRKAEGWRTHLTAPELASFDPKHDYFWHLATTQGEITIKLLPDSAPMHVTNILYLTRLGFYDGLAFHRVIKGFMAQGGCPLGNGRGGPGYNIDGEIDPKQKHDTPGVLSTANTGQPKSDGSQFFITFVPTPHLDGKHTIAGRVSAGMEAVKALEENGGDGSGAPKQRLEITRAWIVAADKTAGDKPAGDKPAGEKGGDKPAGEKGGDKPPAKPKGGN